MDTVLVVGRMPALDGESAKLPEISGFRLVETRDPGDAVRVCEQLKPALAFVEVDSPDGDNFELLSRMRGALSANGRLIAVCNRYSDALDDYCEALGANMALPQIDDRTDFKLYVRGLMTLIPEAAASSGHLACR